MNFCGNFCVNFCEECGSELYKKEIKCIFCGFNNWYMLDDIWVEEKSRSEQPDHTV